MPALQQCQETLENNSQYRFVGHVVWYISIEPSEARRKKFRLSHGVGENLGYSEICYKEESTFFKESLIILTTNQASNGYVSQGFKCKYLVFPFFLFSFSFFLFPFSFFSSRPGFIPVRGAQAPRPLPLIFQASLNLGILFLKSTQNSIIKLVRKIDYILFRSSVTTATFVLVCFWICLTPRQYSVILNHNDFGQLVPFLSLTCPGPFILWQ